MTHVDTSAFEDFNITPPVERVTSLTFSPDAEDLFEPLNWFPNLEHLGLSDYFEGNRLPICDTPLTVHKFTRMIFIYVLKGLRLQVTPMNEIGNPGCMYVEKKE